MPQHLQSTSKAFYDLADAIDKNHMDNSEKTMAIRKLLEAKDAAVRSRLYTNNNTESRVDVSSSDESTIV